jgi:predicted nucleic acid-binding protein
MRLVISDTYPIFYLLAIGQIELLPRLFGRMFAPDAVYGELYHPTGPAALREWIAECPAWLDVISVDPTDDVSLKSLGAGERATITLPTRGPDSDR